MQTRKSTQKNDLQHNEQSALIRTQHLLRSGPIPTPEKLKGYSEVASSLPNRIMRMAEEEQKHQYELRR